MRARQLQTFFRTFTTESSKKTKPSNIENDKYLGLGIFAVGALAGAAAGTMYFVHRLDKAMRR
jgi:hypothetical protein